MSRSEASIPPSRIELRPPLHLSTELHKNVYPLSQYPELRSYQDLYERAAADMVRSRRQKNPEELVNELLEISREWSSGSGLEVVLSIALDRGWLTPEQIRRDASRAILNYNS